MDELQRYFRIEAQELVDSLTRGLLDLERRGGGGEGLDQCFRWAHTLKGAAQTVKQARIGELAHTIEDVLAPHRASGEPIPVGHAGELLRLLEAIRGELAGLAWRAPAAGEGRGAAPEDRRFETARVDLEDVAALADEIGEAAVQLGALRGGLDALAEAERLAAALAAHAGRPAARAAGAPAGRERTVIDSLRAALARARADVGGGLDRLERELRQAQGRARELQLVAAGTVMPSLELAVRDAAEALGKQVDFEATGGEIRLDGHVLAALREAMLHLARNAVDHGVEPPEERALSGKPPAGAIRFRVERRGGRVAFTCTDDGRGVSIDAVRLAAARAGLAPAEEVARLPADEALALIFRPGVSTSAAVTSISGRGVGLDVVREAAARLKGSARASSEPGRGTTVEVVVPVSLSSVNALRLEDAGRETLIPLDAIRGALRLADDAVALGTERDGILHEDRLLPFAPLSVVLGARRPGGRPPRAAVIVEAGGARAALGVERLLGATDVIIKPLPGAVGALPAVAGATFNAQGDPVLMLDPEGVVGAIRAARPGAGVDRSAPLAPVLIVDDSLTARMLEQSILEAEGYEVDLAASGEEGLEKAAARRYGLFLVDVEMPGMSGFELTARVRADPDLRETPIVIVTSLTSAEDRRRGMEAGADGYIVKGEFDQRQLLRTITELMQGRRPRGAP